MVKKNHHDHSEMTTKTKNPRYRQSHFIKRINRSLLWLWGFVAVFVMETLILIKISPSLYVTFLNSINVLPDKLPVVGPIYKSNYWGHEIKTE